MFTWTPGEADGGNTQTVTIRVTDNGVLPLSDTKSFTVAVGEVNVTPVMAALPDQTVDEGAAWSWTLSATDADLPAQTLNYSLVSGPNGAAINSITGVLSWTPTEAQGPGLFPITVKVTDTGTPALSDSKSFNIAVNEVNLAPVLNPIDDKTTQAGKPLSFVVGATDPDLPANKLTYALVTGPGGVTLNASSGQFSWTPPLDQSVGANLVTVRVTDNGMPPLSDTNSFRIAEFGPENTAPVFAHIADRIIDELKTLSFTVNATDAEAVPQKLTFSLEPGAPAGAVMSAAGVFSWTPTEAQGPGTYTIMVTVTDPDGLTGTDQFDLIVLPVNDPPSFTKGPDQSVNEDSGPYTVSKWATNLSPGPADEANQKLTFQVSNNNVALFSIQPGISSDGTLTFTPAPDATGAATVSLTLKDAGGTANSGIDTSATQTFTIAVNPVNDAPALDPIGDLALAANTPLRTSHLSGISAGPPNEIQKITMTVTSDKPALIPNPTVNYTSPNTTGTLTFTPVPNASGTAIITVMVKDDGGAANGGQDTITRSFQVAVTKPPELYVNSVSVNEPATGTVEAVFEVELRGASSLPVTIHFTTVDGTAKAGSDYEVQIGQLEFPASAGAETPRLALIRNSNNLELHWTDGANAFELSETEDLGSTVWRKNALPVAVRGSEHSIALPVSDGMRFFRLTSTTAASSETRRQSVRVLVLSDQDPEPDENFFLRLSNPVNAVIVRGSGKAVIHDGTLPPPPPPPAPVVRIVAPENDDVFPTGSDIFVKAEVSPTNASITKVEFFANGQPIGSAAKSPFAITWTNVVKVDYLLTARATDNAGAQIVSQAVSITVEDVCAGSKKVAIVQNFSAPEISKLQAWMADLDLCSRVFNQEGLTFEALKTYALVIWDDLGELTGGLAGNDVSVFQQVHNAGIPLYFIGNDLARATGTLPANVQSVWTGLLHLKPADTETASQLVTISEQGHDVINGPSGLVGGFKLASDYDATTATGTGETVLARAGDADVLLAHEDGATTTRTVTQNVLAFEGAGLMAGVQREKLFKNAASWLLKLPLPPPFRNLRVALTTPTDPPRVGQPFTFTAEVQHAGELEATGITLTVTLPDGWEFVSAASASGPCTFEDGVVVCLLGRLSRADAASVSITVRPTVSGTATIESNVSSNQPEAVITDNTVENTVDVSP